jgi:hypothetical protein
METSPIKSVKYTPRAEVAKKHTKFGSFDKLAKLEQERKRLVDALDQNKKRIHTGMKILKQKAETKKLTGGYDGPLLPNGEPLKPSMTMQVIEGYSVEDFRQPPERRQKQRTVKKYNVEDVEPKTITDPNMIRIKDQNLKNITGNKKIDDLVKHKQLRDVKEKERAFKKLPKLERRIMPNISVPPSMLPNRYVRGELPCTIEHGINGHYLSWAAPLDNLDYEYYLPIFFDGLQCKDNPSCFLARQGIEDLLFASRGFPNRIKVCVPKLIKPLRNALAKFDPTILLAVLKALQQLVTCNDGVGETLMPYSKQFLAPMAMFMDLHKNIGDSIDYGQRKDNDVGENVHKTLELLEERGGPGAFKAIKFCVPLYESCLQSKVITRGGERPK